MIDQGWCVDPAFEHLEVRLAAQDTLDDHISRWTASQPKFEVEDTLRSAGVPAAAVLTPEERIDHDPSTNDFDLWPTVVHSEMGAVRVDGQPVHFSKTNWQLERGAPCLGEHNEEILTRVLGLTPDEVAALTAEGVL